MTFQKHTQAEFEAATVGKRAGKEFSKERLTIRGLAVGEAISYPCRWKHYHSSCSGIGTIGAASRQDGIKIVQRHVDGVIWVLRIA